MHTNPDTVIIGAGGTLAKKVYSDIIFSRSFVSSTAITYNPVGSGQGINLIENNKVDFCGSDILLSETMDYGVYPDLHTYPTLAAAVAIYHNLEAFRDTDQSLVLARDTVAKIFLGEIVFWDDPSITSFNPNVSLPHNRIHVYVRGDDSGTTSIFTEGLNKFYRNFASSLGKFSSRDGWCQGSAQVNASAHHRGGIDFSCQSCTPYNTNNQLTVCFLSAKQMVDMVAIDPYGISYSVYNPSNAGYVQMASMINKAGRIVQPSTLSASYSTMEQGVFFTPQLTADLLDSGSSFGWPLVSYTYLVMRTKTQISTCDVRKAVVEFWVWFYQHEAVRNMISNLGFVPLPSFIADYVVQRLIEDVMCVDEHGNLSVAAEYLLQTHPKRYLISNSILPGISLMNSMYSSFVNTQFTWDPQNSSSNSIFSSFSRRLAEKTPFSIYNPDLVISSLQQPLEGVASFPYFLYAVVPVFSISGVHYNVNLTAEILAKIFLCEVTAWDDPSILSLNLELQNSGSAGGKRIKIVYLSFDADTTALLSRFLMSFSPSYQKTASTHSNSLPVCSNSTGVDSESLMNAAVAYTDGALGYLSLKLAQSSQLKAVDIISADRTGSQRNIISASIDTVTNCLRGTSAAYNTDESPRELTQFLSLPLGEFGEEQCWPITGVQNIIVNLQFQTNETSSYSSCSDGRAVGNYLDWLLDVNNVNDIFSANFYVPTPANEWQKNKAMLQHNMMCDEELLLITIPACTLDNYEYAVHQCQGYIQKRMVTFSFANNGSECLGGQGLPPSGFVECDHLLPDSSFGTTVSTLCGIGILVAVLSFVFQSYHFEKFVKEGHARVVLNSTIFFAAVLSCVCVMWINIGAMEGRMCMLRLWFLQLPVDFMFAILYAKIRMGYAIFTAKHFKKMKATWQVLLRWILEVIAGEIVILMLWSILGGPQSVSTFDTLTLNRFYFVQVPVVSCSSKYSKIFAISLLLYKLCWYLFSSFMAFKITVGATLAFQLRNMKIHQRETRFVGLAILNFICFSCVLLWFENFWSSPLELIFGQSLLVLWISTTTAMLTIWPIVRKVKVLPFQTNVRISSKISLPNFNALSAVIQSSILSNQQHDFLAGTPDKDCETVDTDSIWTKHTTHCSNQQLLHNQPTGINISAVGLKEPAHLEPLPERPSEDEFVSSDFQCMKDPRTKRTNRVISQEVKELLDCENEQNGPWVNRPVLVQEEMGNTPSFHRINFHRASKVNEMQRNSDTIEGLHQDGLMHSPH